MLHRLPPKGSSRASALLLVAAAILLLPTVAAPEGESEDPESELDETRDRMDEVASELDLLRLSDQQLEVRLADLDTRISAQVAVVERRRAEADAALAEVVSLEADVDAAQRHVDLQQHLLDQRTVSAYIDAGGSRVDSVFESEDYNEYSKRVALLDQVAEHDRDLLDGLVEARVELADRQHEASLARQDADRLEAEAEAALADLEAARAEQQAVQDALSMRISQFQHEADELAAEEDALLTVIAERASPPPSIPPPTAPPTTSPTSSPGTNPGTSTSAPATTASTAPQSTVPGGPAFQWPLGGVVTSPFGWRWGRLHAGIDIGAFTGDPISAAAGGTVILASEFGGYGNCVMVDHGGGFVTLYAHQSELWVSEGETVSAGQTVGLAGSTGHSTGPHLHFEVRVGGTPYDPMLYLP